jgi:hypothetical protein
LAQYFAPPVVEDLATSDLHMPYGGRYRAALFGSRLPGVIACGVVGRGYGPIVFVSGKPRILATGADTARAQEGGNESGSQ